MKKSTNLLSLSIALGCLSLSACAFADGGFTVTGSNTWAAGQTPAGKKLILNRTGSSVHATIQNTDGSLSPTVSVKDGNPSNKKPNVNYGTTSAPNAKQLALSGLFGSSSLDVVSKGAMNDLFNMNDTLTVTANKTARSAAAKGLSVIGSNTWVTPGQTPDGRKKILNRTGGTITVIMTNADGVSVSVHNIKNGNTEKLPNVTYGSTSAPNAKSVNFQGSFGTVILDVTKSNGVMDELFNMNDTLTITVK